MRILQITYSTTSSSILASVDVQRWKFSESTRLDTRVGKFQCAAFRTSYWKFQVSSFKSQQEQMTIGDLLADTRRYKLYSAKALLMSVYAFARFLVLDTEKENAHVARRYDSALLRMRGVHASLVEISACFRPWLMHERTIFCDTREHHWWTMFDLDTIDQFS